jgi:hypothetical protein
MRTTLTLEHELDCGCKIRTVIHTTYDGPFDLHGRVLKTWLAKTMEAHVCPKEKK